MIGEDQIAAVLHANPRLRDAGEALIAAANEAGGRDNITVVLIRLEDVHVGQAAALDEHATMVGLPAVSAAPPTRRRTPRVAPASASVSQVRPRRRPRHLGALAFLATVLIVIGSGAYLAFQSVYFIGTNNRGLVTMFEGLPYRLPGNLALYSSQYVSGVSASTLSPEKRHMLFNHLRSESNAGSLIRGLELEQLE
jgi:hypothetical protein